MLSGWRYTKSYGYTRFRPKCKDRFGIAIKIKRLLHCRPYLYVNIRTVLVKYEYQTVYTFPSRLVYRKAFWFRTEVRSFSRRSFFPRQRRGSRSWTMYSRKAVDQICPKQLVRRWQPYTPRTNHDLDSLLPQLPLWEVVQDQCRSKTGNVY